MVRPGVHPGAGILHTVGEGVRHLQIRRRARFLHMVAGNADAVPLRHVLRRIREDVGDDLHRRQRRIDVGVADHELLEDVVLDGPGQLRRLHALLLGGDDIERQDRQDRSVHGHRHGHFVERDPVEQHPHVGDRIDGHAGHAHIARHAWIVGVVAAMGGQVERHRKTLLARRQVAPIKRIAVLGGGEARVLAHRPRPGDVHRRIGSPDIGRNTGHRVQVIQPLEIAGRIKRLHVHQFGGLPHELLGRFPGFLFETRGPIGMALAAARRVLGVQVDVGKIGNTTH